MKIGRIETLKSQHARLERELATLSTWPSADPEKIHLLKRQKLCVKDQLAAAWTQHRAPMAYEARA